MSSDEIDDIDKKPVHTINAHFFLEPWRLAVKYAGRELFDV